MSVSDVLNSFCSLVLSEDYLRSAFIHSGTLRSYHGGSKEASFRHYSDDARMNQALTVAAQGLIMRQELWTRESGSLENVHSRGRVASSHKR